MTPYVVHPIWCAATILCEPNLPAEVRRLGCRVLLWHDTLEDTTLPLPASVDTETARYVEEMTFDSFAQERELIWERSETTRLFKLYDKVSNLLDGTWMGTEKWNVYATHTRRLTDDVRQIWGGLNM